MQTGPSFFELKGQLNFKKDSNLIMIDRLQYRRMCAAFSSLQGSSASESLAVNSAAVATQWSAIEFDW